MILRTENLTKEFNGIVATDHLNYEIDQGEVQAVIGPNGAGKTTLFNLITGTLHPDAGDIYFKDEAITGMPIDAPHQRHMIPFSGSPRQSVRERYPAPVG